MLLSSILTILQHQNVNVQNVMKVVKKAVGEKVLIIVKNSVKSIVLHNVLKVVVLVQNQEIVAIYFVLADVLDQHKKIA